MNSLIIRKGDIFYADLSPVVGAEQSGIRPVVVIQNDIANKYVPTVIVACITSDIKKSKLPTHVEISADEYGLNRNSIIILEQVRTIDKRRIRDRIGKLSEADINKVERAIAVSLDFKIENTIDDKEKDNVIKDVEEINMAISILKGFAKKNNIEQYIYNEEIEEKYKKLIEDLSEDFSDLSSEFKNMYSIVSPLVEKQKIARGKLTEYATIEYFKNNEYEAEKGDNILDKLKIDVVAKDDKYKIFTQVKAGQISSKEIVKLVKIVKDLDHSYDEEGLSRMACVCADTFPPSSDMIRIRLEKEYEIPIMFIHKYQVLKLCPQYKSTVS